MSLFLPVEQKQRLIDEAKAREEEEQQARQYAAECATKAEDRAKLRETNLAAVGKSVSGRLRAHVSQDNRPNDSDLRKLDSSVKKNTALVKKLVSYWCCDNC